MPERIQLSRKKGWRLPPGGKSVARPGRFGNPITVAMMAEHYPEDSLAELHRKCVSDFRGVLEGRFEPDDDNQMAGYPSIDEIRAELAGRDLACWCRHDLACHVDVLLRVAAGG